MGRGKGRKGDHLARGIAYVKLFYVFGQHTVRGVCLKEDTLDPAALNEIVYIGTAEGL